jgi:large repetitive protein
VARGTTATFDLSLVGTGTYYARVVASLVGGYGDASNDAVVTLGSVRTARVAAGCELPAAPRSLVASSSGALAQLSWQAGDGAATSGYTLQVGTAAGRQDLMLLSLGGGTSVSGTVSDGHYFLRLVAVNDCGSSELGADADLVVGSSAATAAAAVQQPVALPGAPEGLTSTVVGATVTLTWAPPASGGNTTRYLIEATTAGGPVGVDTGHAGTSFTHPNTPSGTYVIRVRAANAAGAGPASAAITVVVP